MAPPPLPPLSCVAGSLALSFTGAAQPATRPADGPLSLELPEPPPAATPATPPAITPPPTQPEPPAAPPPPTVTWFGAPEQPEPAAAPKPALRASEKRFFFTLFVGGARTLFGGYTNPYASGMDFKLEGAIGGHGKRRKSLGGAAVVQLRTTGPMSSFTLAPRLQWDKQIVPDHAIYFTTTATFGYRLTVGEGSGGYYGSSWALYSGGVAAVGWGVSAIVADRLLLTFRPVNPELELNSFNGFSINWDVFGGLGVVW